MRKNTSFAITATIMGLAVIFWAKSGVIATSADMARPKAGLSYVAMPGTFLPAKAI
jgi:hypothetical protein